MTSVTAMPGPPTHSIPHVAPVSSSTLPSVHDASHSDLPASTASSNVPRGPVSTILNFYQAPKDGSAPFNYVETPPEGQPQRNFGFEPETVKIQDLRGKENTISLDKHAFSALQGWPHNQAIDWHNDESIKKEYYPEVEKILLSQIPGSPSRVFIFDHTVRRAEPNAHRAPVTRAHIDQTPKSAEQRVEYHLPEEADKLKQGRYRLINVWRPLNGAVESHPLAFADSQTVPDDDMVAVEHRYPDRSGQTAGVKYNPDHSWYYWSGMDNDERLLLQCFDSERPMNRVPHSAFEDPRSTPQSKGRESIEVRALVFG